MGLSTVQVRVSEEHLVRVLVIDDEPVFQNEMREFWEQQGCAVMIATNLKEGESLLDRNTYEIVIADVRFKSSKLRGDEFVLQHRDKLGEAKVFVVTAQGLTNIKHYNDLNNLGYKVLDKSDYSFPETLQEAAIEKGRERKSSIETVVREAVSSELGEGSVSVSVIPISDNGRVVDPSVEGKRNQALEILNEEIIGAQGTLGLWLRSRSQPNEPIIAMGSKVMSANELADAVEAGNEYGITLLRLFMSEFKHQLGKRLGNN